MNGVLLLNGEYGELGWYQNRAKGYQQIICADGGGNYAHLLGIDPTLIVGDMDSIWAPTLEYFSEIGVPLRTVPKEKDFTDTQLALEVAREMGVTQATLWGAIGDRLDHTLATIFSVISFIKRGMTINLESPQMTIHFVMGPKGKLSLAGNLGDTVSVLAIGTDANGVELKGFQYPLSKATLKAFEPIGVSNVLTQKNAEIRVEDGILAVFQHNKNF